MKLQFPLTTRLPDLLDRNGEISAELGSPDRDSAAFFTEIVASVSGARTLMLSDPIRCPRLRGKRRCAGHISAWCYDQDPEAPIHWRCDRCQDGGTVHDWQNTRFNQWERRKQREYEHIAKGVWINGYRLDELELRLPPDPGGGGTRRAIRFPSERTVVSHHSGGGITLTVPAELAIELYRRGILSPAVKTATVTVGHSGPLACRFIDVVYSIVTNGTVQLAFLVETP